MRTRALWVRLPQNVSGNVSEAALDEARNGSGVDPVVLNLEKEPLLYLLGSMLQDHLLRAPALLVRKLHQARLFLEPLQILWEIWMLECVGRQWSSASELRLKRDSGPHRSMVGDLILEEFDGVEKGASLAMQPSEGPTGERNKDPVNGREGIGALIEV